jgi:hypothetical protein
MAVWMPFADSERAAGGLELDRRASDHAKHSPIGLRPALGLTEANAMHRRDSIVPDRSKGRNQSGDVCSDIGIAVCSRAAWMKPQDIT